MSQMTAKSPLVALTNKRQILQPGVLFLCITALCAFSANIYYFSVVVFHIPYIDDWSMIRELGDYINGNNGFSYFFERHNGHPYLITRILYLVDFKFFHLNLAYMRFCTSILIIISSIVFSFMVFHICNEDLQVRYPTILGSLAAAVVSSSMSQWELLTLSISQSNVAVNIFVGICLLSFFYWLRKRSIATLFFTVVFGLLASANMAQGFLIWIALAAMAYLSSSNKSNILISLLFTFCFLFFGLAAKMSGSSLSISLNFIDLMSIIKGGIIVLGLPLSGNINNAPVLNLIYASGVLVAFLCLICILAYFRDDESYKKRMLPFLALLIYGCASIALVAIGRKGGDYTASRYVTVALPAIVGIIGICTVAATARRHFLFFLASITLLIFVGWFMAATDEMKLAEARLALERSMDKGLKDWSMDKDHSKDAAWLFIDPNTTPDVGATLDLMKKYKLQILLP